jgi:hypothetical protein
MGQHGGELLKRPAGPMAQALERKFAGFVAFREDACWNCLTGNSRR